MRVRVSLSPFFIYFSPAHVEFPRCDAIPSRKIKLLVCANALDYRLIGRYESVRVQNRSNITSLNMNSSFNRIALTVAIS